MPPGSLSTLAVMNPGPSTASRAKTRNRIMRSDGTRISGRVGRSELRFRKRMKTQVLFSPELVHRRRGALLQDLSHTCANSGQMVESSEVSRSLDDPALFCNRELSLLAFQKRVLDEAKDAANPPLERVNF